MPRGVNMLSSKDILSVMKERPLICTPIAADNSDSYLDSLQSAKNMGSDIAEFRIDYFNNISSEILSNVIYESELPLIVTNRNREDGGMFSGGEDVRLELLETAIESKPSFVDIELAIDREKRDNIIQKARINDVGIICSYHDFRHTPTPNEILKIYSDINETGANVAKMVFTPVTNKDIRNILSVIEKFSNNEMLFTIFGMRQKGQITRMLTPLLGACLTYCSLYKDPNNNLGQADLQSTRKYFDMMGTKGWSVIRNKRDVLMNLDQIEFNEDGSYPLASIDQLLK
jgi:3-dehydroquinate dehydratase I